MGALAMDKSASWRKLRTGSEVGVISVACPERGAKGTGSLNRTGDVEDERDEINAERKDVAARREPDSR